MSFDWSEYLTLAKRLVGQLTGPLSPEAIPDLDNTQPARDYRASASRSAMSAGCSLAKSFCETLR